MMSKLGGGERRLKDVGKDRIGEVDVIIEKMPSALHSLFFIGCIVDFMKVMPFIDKDDVAIWLQLLVVTSSRNSSVIFHFPYSATSLFYSIHSTKSFEQLQPTGFAISELSSRIPEQLLQALPIR